MKPLHDDVTWNRDLAPTPCFTAGSASWDSAIRHAAYIVATKAAAATKCNSQTPQDLDPRRLRCVPRVLRVVQHAHGSMPGRGNRSRVRPRG